jgi:hypothetical protein
LVLTPDPEHRVDDGERIGGRSDLQRDAASVDRDRDAKNWQQLCSAAVSRISSSSGVEPAR